MSKPAGSTATLSGATTSSASFLADKVGRYEVRVVVRDENSWSPADTVVIDATNAAPVARAGPDQSFTTFGGFVELDGSASSDADPEDAIVQWNWWIASAPSGSTATLGGYDTSRASLSADKLGTYVIRLTVFDGWVWSAPDEVVVTFANRPPIAGPDATTSVAGNAVVVDVLANDSDPEGDDFVLTAVTPPAQGALDECSSRPRCRARGSSTGRTRAPAGPTRSPTRSPRSLGTALLRRRPRGP